MGWFTRDQEPLVSAEQLAEWAEQARTAQNTSFPLSQIMDDGNELALDATPLDIRDNTVRSYGNHHQRSLVNYDEL